MYFPVIYLKAMHLIVQIDRPTVRTNVGRDIVRLPAVILSPELPYENKNL